MDQPTAVQLADGTSYAIEPGPWGSFEWVRQANLVAKAYDQLGDAPDRDQWTSEYNRRLSIWNALQAGQDAAAVAVQFGKDLILAPLSIAQDVGGAVITLGGGVVSTVFDWAKWLPWLILAGIVVVGVGLHKGSIGYRR